jgi:hypothetical protein
VLKKGELKCREGQICNERERERRGKDNKRQRKVRRGRELKKRMADLAQYEGESVRAGLNGGALMVEYQLFARWQSADPGPGGRGWGLALSIQYM